MVQNIIFELNFIERLLKSQTFKNSFSLTSPYSGICM